MDEREPDVLTMLFAPTTDCIAGYSPSFSQRLLKQLIAWRKEAKLFARGQPLNGKSQALKPAARAVIAQLYKQVFRQECDLFEPMPGSNLVSAVEADIEMLIEAVFGLLGVEEKQREREELQAQARKKTHLDTRIFDVVLSTHFVTARFHSVMEREGVQTICGMLQKFRSEREFRSIGKIGAGKIHRDVLNWLRERDLRFGMPL